MNSPLVSIVIPTYNRKKMLFRLLKSILSASYKNIEIIIVDDASSDGSFEEVKKKYKTEKKIKIIRNKKNLHAASSRNIGLKKSRGKFIIFIDDDNVVDKNMLSVLVEEFIKDPMIGEIGPVNYNYSSKRKILWARTHRNMSTSKTNQARSMDDLRKYKVWETDDIPNAFMVRSDIIRKNNLLFREKYGIMYEESDFAYRIRKLGYKIVVVRDARIFHDIDNYIGGKKIKDYMYHFMEDKRRPYVIARNRIIFHSIFSTKIQFLYITTVWIWVFMSYYIYKILFYSGKGNFTLSRKFSLIISYGKGMFDGLKFVVEKKIVE